MLSNRFLLHPHASNLVTLFRRSVFVPDPHMDEWNNTVTDPPNFQTVILVFYTSTEDKTSGTSRSRNVYCVTGQTMWVERAWKELCATDTHRFLRRYAFALGYETWTRRRKASAPPLPSSTFSMVWSYKRTTLLTADCQPLTTTGAAFGSPNVREC